MTGGLRARSLEDRVVGANVLAAPRTSTASRGLIARAIADLRTWPWAAILFLHVVYVAANFSLDLIPYPTDTTVSVDMFVAGSENGMIGRRIAFVALALVALVGLARRGRSVLRVRGMLGVLMVAYFALAGASYFWADDSTLVIRKLVLMVCVWLGAIWAAVELRPRGILRFAFVSSMLTTLTAVVIELAAGRFRPWVGGFRLAGMQQPNDLAQCVAIGVVAAVALSVEVENASVLYWIAALGGGIALIMTGSRTSLFAAVAALAVYFAIVSLRRRAVAWFILAGSAVSALGALAITVAGYNVVSVLVNVISLGRNDSDLKSLTMRTPLWQELISRYISARPFSGYGYASFWTERHITQLSIGMHGFVYGHSHSGYIEMALSLGLIGAALHVTTIIWASLREAQSFRVTGKPARAFGAAVLVALLVGMIGEPLNLAVALMPTFVAMAFIAKAAFVIDTPAPTQGWDGRSA
jgi:O-antigen ligase